MTKNEAQIIVDLIHKTEAFPESIVVKKEIQTVVDKYINSLLKHNPKINYSRLKSEVNRKTNNFIKPFDEAIKRKLRAVFQEHYVTPESKPESEEKRYLIKEVANLLEMTSQNLNRHLRNHPEINVIEISSRKRYLTESEIEKLKNL
ncbi:MAG: hypothetical protein HKN52_05330 [Eudoraea sp.]|nr:hypothetical protein [Eudoraea sp.]NNK55550.1 hypothetical protein [Flavobacteriaceae bacterium]